MGLERGGAIIVDKKYEEIIRKLINFGIDLDSISFCHRLGNNYKMSDIAAVYIIQYLENFNQIVDTNQNLYKYLCKQINDKNITKFKLFPSFHDNVNILPACFCLLFENYDNKIIELLHNNDIFSKKYYHPLKLCHNTNIIYNKILCIPCTLDMTTNDIDKFLDTIITFNP